MLLAMMVSACATTSPEGAGAGEEKPAKGAKAPRVEVQVSTGKIDLEQGVETLADTVRKIGQAKAGGIVMLNGLGFETLQPISWKGRHFDDAVADIAQQVKCQVDSTGGYAFLFPQGYEVLNQWQLDGALPAEASGISTSAAFGNGTKVSSALAFLSNATGITLLADNAVADSRAGELWLPTLDLATVLEALLKSARIPPDSVTFQTGPGIVLFRSKGNRAAAARLGGEDAGALQQRVTVYLPEAPQEGGHFPMEFGATPLGQLLPQLSRQMGVPLQAGAGIAELPVEQCAFINQPRAMVLEYLINQWPAPGIGFRWEGGGVVIERQ